MTSPNIGPGVSWFKVCRVLFDLLGSCVIIFSPSVCCCADLGFDCAPSEIDCVPSEVGRGGKVLAWAGNMPGVFVRVVLLCGCVGHCVLQLVLLG